MEIHAYNPLYLYDAQRNLGDAFDYGIVTLGYPAEDFSIFLINSDVSRQFEKGNPKYVSGMNGCELCRLILEQNGLVNDAPDEMHLEKSPEYWAGWSLAYYQWYTCRSFEDILTTISLEEILKMYPVYHEMDERQFVDTMNKWMKERQKDTRLEKFRVNKGMDRQTLAHRTGITEIEIRRLEERTEDINHIEVWKLYNLSRILDCMMEELVEK